MNTNIRKRHFFSTAPLFILCACVLALFSCSSEPSSPSQPAVKSYTVTFDANGGTPAPTPQRINSEGKASQPDNPKRSGSVFAGWFSDKELTVLFNFEDAIDKNIALYAKWAAPITNKTLAGIIQAGYIPDDIASYPDDVVKEIFALYRPGAGLVVKRLKPGGSGSKDGSSWTNAAANLRTVVDGITNASNNNVYFVLLAAGEYKAEKSIYMKNNIAIIGGFAGTTDDDYSASVDATTLSGEDKYRVIANRSLNATALFYRLNIHKGWGDNGGGMININSSSPTIMRVNFANNVATEKGGAILNQDASSPTLTNVTFTDNSAADEGGAMVNTLYSSPILTNVIFSKNSVTNPTYANSSGGAMYNYSSSNPLLMNVRFDSNSAQFAGGAMANQLSHPRLTNVTFVGNSTIQNSSSPSNPINGGGAMANFSSEPILTNVTFVGNSGFSGGAMLNAHSSYPILTNVTFVGNSSSEQAGAMVNLLSSSPIVTNSIFWGNTLKGSTAGAQIMLDITSYISFYHNVLQGGRNRVDTSGENNRIIAYVNMDDRDPGLSATLAYNEGFVPTLPIVDANSGAKDIGLFAKRTGSTLYFSEDNISWVTINGDDNRLVPSTLPPTAIDLTTIDARGYQRVGRPDAGAYEYGANP